MNFNAKIVFLVPGFPKDEADENCLPYLQDLMMLLKGQMGADQLEVVAFQYPFKR